MDVSHFFGFAQHDFVLQIAVEQTPDVAANMAGPRRKRGKGQGGSEERAEAGGHAVRSSPSAKIALHRRRGASMGETNISETNLPKHFLEAAASHAGRRMPPVERWNPDYCGEIPMRIARDGRWFYMGTPINRMPLVRLFASVLRKDAERHVLVTPVERVGIEVEDAPFLAVEMEPVTHDGLPTLAFRTNLDEVVVVGKGHPLRFTTAENDGFKPYVLVRGGLWARLTRALALDLAERLETRGDGAVGIEAGGGFYPVPMEALA
jgi:uncharacterized protein